MSFLDSLENNLKALESQDQGGIDDSRRRETEKKRALAAAPWAERLKNGPFTKALMSEVTRAGFQRRVKVNLVWLGSTLRLDAAGERMELQPTPDGVVALFGERREKVALDGSPSPLIAAWMKIVDAARQAAAEQDRLAAAEAEQLAAAESEHSDIV